MDTTRPTPDEAAGVLERVRHVQADAVRSAADESTRGRWRGPCLVVVLGLMGLVYDLASPWRWVALGLVVVLFAAVVLVQRSRARLRVRGDVWLRHQDDRSFWRWYLSFGPGILVLVVGSQVLDDQGVRWPHVLAYLAAGLLWAVTLPSSVRASARGVAANVEAGHEARLSWLPAVLYVRPAQRALHQLSQALADRRRRDREPTRP